MMEEEGGWKYLELKVISCRDVKAFNLIFQKPSVYAVVSIFNDEEDCSDKQRQKTAVLDREGGGNPEWNEVMQFDLTTTEPYDHDHLFLKFKLHCGGVVFGKRSIGEVRVPLKDLIQEFNGSSSSVRFLSYQVRSISNGKPNGVLNFSYTLKGKKKKKENHESHVSAAVAAGSTYSSSNHKQPPPSFYPSLDDIQSPSPAVSYYQPMPAAFSLAPHGVHHPSPLMVHYPALNPLCYTTQTLASLYGNNVPGIGSYPCPSAIIN